MKSGTLIALVALLGVMLYATPWSYLYCLAREDSWMQAKTRGEMEARLIGFHTESQTTPEVPGWGMGHSLKEDESMTRYLILGKEPLDVVYSGNGDVVAIYTTYE